MMTVHGNNGKGLPQHVLVDGYNVLHAVLLTDERETIEWWQPMYQQRVLAWAEALCTALGAGGGRVTLVFDASRPLQVHERLGSDVVSVVYAPVADDWIVEACRQETAIVVSADRALADRARVWGAHVVKPWKVSSLQG
jgi:predicted RNA-binding protein with PIN domain